MSGHGHVTPNADGSRARCGGPGFCTVCSKELAALPAAVPKPTSRTVRVRIPVEVAPNGRWYGIGDSKRGQFVTGPTWAGGVIHYVEATLPIPEPPEGVTVEGEVKGG